MRIRRLLSEDRSPRWSRWQSLSSRKGLEQVKRLISVVSPCYNEDLNVEELAQRVRALFKEFRQYDYEHIFIDNASRDGTVTVLKRLASTDTHIKIIVNSRNFGHLRSPMHAMFEAAGDAVVLLFSD